MGERQKKTIRGRGITLIALILVMFSVISVVVYFVARRVSTEMSDSAVVNLGESMELIKNTIQTVMSKDAEYQKMMAAELHSWIIRMQGDWIPKQAGSYAGSIRNRIWCLHECKK